MHSGWRAPPKKGTQAERSIAILAQGLCLQAVFLTDLGSLANIALQTPMRTKCIAVGAHLLKREPRLKDPLPFWPKACVSKLCFSRTLAHLPTLREAVAAAAALSFLKVHCRDRWGGTPSRQCGLPFLP